MLDFLRNLTKSEEEKRQEMLHAYVDDALSPGQRQKFEVVLAEDDALQAEVAQMQHVKQLLRRLPHERAPRNFTLDPAVYGRPASQPLVQAYPVLRIATALTAFFFVLAIALDLFTPGGRAPQQMALRSDATESQAAKVAAEVVGEAGVAEPRLEEEAVETAVAEAPAEEPVEEAAPAEEEEMAEADVEADTAATRTPLPTPTVSELPRAPTEPAVAQERVEDVAATAETERTVEAETAVVQARTIPSPTPTPLPSALSRLGGFRWLQIGLAVLLLVLGTAALLARRQFMI